MLNIILLVIAGLFVTYILHRGFTYVVSDIFSLIETIRDKYNKIRGK